MTNKSKQYGAASAAMIGLVVFAVLALLIVLKWFSAYNTAVGFEEKIIASYTKQQTILGQHAPKLKEALGVTALQTDALERLFTGANAARYGGDGSKAMMQWIQEQNPNLDQSTFAKVQAMIEAGRNDFTISQQFTADQVALYRKYYRNPINKVILDVSGMPEPVVKDGKETPFFDFYGKVVMSSHATKSFETGVDDGVDVKAAGAPVQSTQTAASAAK